MKSIIKVVVTGGPCGGKTSCLDELTKYFRSEGYSVFIVSEAATELINDGVRPFGDFHLSTLEFQRFVLKAQLEKEMIRERAAITCKNEKAAIIYDRGIFDGRAFLTDEEFQKLIDDEKLDEATVLSRYDLIIHLVTAAIGKEEYYTTANNTARTETVEQARLNDHKTMEAWKNHPNQKIITNDTLFDEKIQKAINTIRAYLGEEEIIRKERYLIDEDDIDFNLLTEKTSVKEEDEEFVSRYDDEEDDMYCKSTINGSSYYTHVILKFNEDGTTRKQSRIISSSDYTLAKSLAHSRPVEKTRFNFIDNDERYRLDVYDLISGKLLILERDVTEASKKALPSFVRKALNVTNNRNYTEDSICIDEFINRFAQSIN